METTLTHFFIRVNNWHKTKSQVWLRLDLRYELLSKR